MNRQTQMLAVAVYGIVVVAAFILSSPAVAIVIIVLGAMVLGLVYRFGTPTGVTGGGRNRNRNRR